MTSLLERTRNTSEITTLMESFTLARHYAVNASSHVSVCGSSNGQTCDGAWQSGLIAYSHAAPKAEPNEPNTEIIYQQKAKDSFDMIGNIRKFTFRPSGLLRGQSGSLLYCPKSNTEEAMSRIVVSRGGRVRVYSRTQLQKITYLSEMNCN
ncbi:MAG: GspH/FimT family pseudopilin [Pseudomonadales bacterium]|nr:GspH/FimT family pseudopilin [Pseudomonadales bacterium]